MQLFIFQKKLRVVFLVIFLLIILGVTVLVGQQAAFRLAKAGGCPAQKISVAQVSANSAVVAWESENETQGRVEYGVNAGNLTFSTPEGSAGKKHNVPLTLLTPNTVYYYLITIGKNRCDSTGQSCSDSCVPFTFTTSTASPPGQIVSTNTPAPTSAASPTKTATTSATTKPSGPVPTSGLSAFCSLVRNNVGKNSKDTNWSKTKQYDVDGNGVVNGLDIFKCQKEGK